MVASLNSQDLRRAAPWRIGITLGDVAGIGPEITLKALAALAGEPGPDFLVVGDAAVIHRANRDFGLPLQPMSDASSAARFQYHDPSVRPLPDTLRPGAPEAALAAVRWLQEAGERCLRGELAGVVTAPVSKAAIIRAGVPFVGQTEFFSELAGTKQTAMMLLAPDDRGRWLRVVLVTTHLPLRRVADAITSEAVALACELGAKACSDLGLDRARLGVAGLNPHAGESGELGREEIEIIGPTLERLRDKGMEVVGPVPADTLFHQALRGDYDVVVAMYHDQGLGPLKMIGFERGVNWTLGLPFIRTSPDHGTAYDLAGKGRADAGSMLAAIRLAMRLVERRSGGRSP
ncbi:MAG: 4-hydroxythreonine-4-phosphate dehydrogenase PdxA [Verrucomicrobiales bacterium]|nr:4-hydroxythreonine-4-phosphate dehydrogenase PdxA [Verrucomicrobiales bacterium]